MRALAASLGLLCLVSCRESKHPVEVAVERHRARFVGLNRALADIGRDAAHRAVDATPAKTAPFELTLRSSDELGHRPRAEALDGRINAVAVALEQLTSDELEDFPVFTCNLCLDSRDWVTHAPVPTQKDPDIISQMVDHIEIYAALISHFRYAVVIEGEAARQGAGWRYRASALVYRLGDRAFLGGFRFAASSPDEVGLEFAARAALIGKLAAYRGPPAPR